MAKKKKSFPIVPVLVLVIVVLVGAFVGPKVVHECADCGETFFGAGYEPSEVIEFLEGSKGDDNVICEECAEEQHAIELALGKTLEDFKLDIF
ncbi:MAG: hypothetical protein IJE14_01775 [Clostridia bacterium]|nr:hypothetical protein [Clostridia bacterium]